MSSRVSSPESGKPPPNALPIVTMSGAAPECSTPHQLPVRPKPVIISSAMRSAPSSSASDCDRGQEVVRRDDVAGGALHRLDDDGGDRAGARDLDCLRPTSTHPSPHDGYSARWGSGSSRHRARGERRAPSARALSLNVEPIRLERAHGLAVKAAPEATRTRTCRCALLARRSALSTASAPPE